MPYPLRDVHDQLINTLPKEKTAIDVNFNQLNKDAFKLAIPAMPSMSEHDLATLIKNNIEIISKDILGNDTSYVPLLNDSKFISALIRAINSIPISYTIQLACNKITYDYFTSDNPDQGIKQQYLNMSKTVNKDTINKLIGIGLSETIASNLALCRYSSANEKTNVKRLNFAIYNRDPEIMTEQMVVWIYEKLFTRISDLFQATMFEVYSYQQQEDFGDNFMEVYGTVGLAILLILNNMPSESIRRVLVGYSQEWVYSERPPVRFSLHALSEDYSRIKRIVDYVTKSEGYVIP